MDQLYLFAIHYSNNICIHIYRSNSNSDCMHGFEGTDSQQHTVFIICSVYSLRLYGCIHACVLWKKIVSFKGLIVKKTVFISTLYSTNGAQVRRGCILQKAQC